MSWVSAHIFYHDVPDRLLTDGVAPLVARSADCGLADGAFFLRYWLGGPHVRLRLRTTPANEAALRRFVDDELRAYLAAHPSPRTLAADELRALHAELAVSVPDAPGFSPYANNSVAFIDYEPELGKYGGRDGVDVAERVFVRGSELVLALLATPAPRLTLALRALALAVDAFALGPAAPAFLRRYVTLWSPFFRHSTDETMRRWAADRQRQRAHIDALVRAPLTADEPLRAWHATLAEARGQATTLLRERRLRFEQAALADQPGAALAWLLTSFVHTFNNRLGIQPQQESFVAYLLAAALDDGAAPRPEAV